MTLTEIKIKDLIDKLYKVNEEQYFYIDKVLDKVLSKQALTKARENKTQRRLNT